MPVTNIYPYQMSLLGTYTGTNVLEYMVKIYPDPQGSTFQVQIVNFNRSVQLQFQGLSTQVTVRSDDGDNTFSTDADGIPIWVGDKIYELGGQTSITANATGFIGTVGSITTGTEGESVKVFQLTNTTYLDDINSNDKVDVLCDYQQQPFEATEDVGDYQDDGETYTHANMYGLELYFNNELELAAPASADTYSYFMFTGYPQKKFTANKMVKLTKDGKTHIIGWNKSLENLSILKDIYDENENMVAPPLDSDALISTPLPIEPTFTTRGDDTYVGRGPDNAPLYIGYPNIKQFGKNMGSDVVVTDGALSLDTSVLPSLEQFVLPTQGTQMSSLNLALNITLASQLIVGYVKNSSYLIKGRRDTGVESSYYIGGQIKAIYLDPAVNDEVWVLYDAVSYYGLQCIDIKDTTETMALHENRVYSLQGHSDADLWVTPFSKDEVVPTDMIVHDGRVYISVTDADYDDEDKTPKEKCFGNGTNRQAFIWRSGDITSAPGSVPDNGYTLLSMTDMTPSMATVEESQNDQVAPYYYRWKEEDWWDVDLDTGQGTGGMSITDNGFTGNAGSLKLLQLPAKRGLCLYSNKTDAESVGLFINYVHNTFQDSEETPVVAYGGDSDGDASLGSSWEWKRVGPLVRQQAKHVALGSHLIIWENSAERNVGNSTSSVGVKRIMLNNSSRGTGFSVNISAEGQGASSSGSANITVHGSGAVWTDAHAVNTVINTVAAPQPRAITVCFGKNMQWWNTLAISDALLNASDQDGHFYLNNSIDTKLFTPDTSKPGPIRPAAQTFSYNTTSSKFSWLAVTFPDSFVCRFLDDVALQTEDTVWAKWALLSTVKISVGNNSGSELDNNNVTPSATLEGSDPPVYDDHEDYYKNFYKLSLMLDGYQESCLGETVYENGSQNPNKLGHLITIEVLADKLPSRLSHVNIYRGRAWDENATEPDLDYQLLESIKLDGAGWKSSTDGYVKYEIIDNKGTKYGSYEALTGMSPNMTTNWVSYGEAEQCAGYLFVCNANNSEMANVGNYIFRSKAGKFSMFNWANEYTALPDKPTALKAFKNMLFAFTNSKVYTINPNNLSIVDTMEGMGCLHPDSVIATDFGMFFADKNGVYQHNGRQGQVISMPIFTTDNSSLTNFTWDSISESLLTSPPKLGFDGQRKALLIVFDVASNSYAWVYSVATKRWDLWSFITPVTALTQGKFGDVLASDGKLLQIGTSSTRKAWEFVSKKITAGLDTYEKSFTEVRVEGDSGLVTKYKTSGIGTYQSLTSNRIASAYKKAKWLQLQVVDSSGSKKMESIGVHLRPLKARSSKV